MTVPHSRCFLAANTTSRQRTGTFAILSCTSAHATTHNFFTVCECIASGSALIIAPGPCLGLRSNSKLAVLLSSQLHARVCLGTKHHFIQAHRFNHPSARLIAAAAMASKRKADNLEGPAAKKTAGDGLVNKKRVNVLKSGTVEKGPVVYW